MNVLVTGSSGFVGRHMVRALRERGDEVVTLDRVGSGGSEWPRDPFHLTTAQEFAAEWNRWVGCPEFDLVVHCAAVVGGRKRLDEDGLGVAENLEIDSSLLRWAARYGVGRVLYFSSSAVYPVELQLDGGAGWGRPLVETDRYGLGDHSRGEPDGIYGWAKWTGEILCEEVRRAGTPVTVVRPFSGYGEDQGAEYPFGAFRDRAVAREDPFVVWGSGEQVRDWIHIDDVVYGALDACDAEIACVNLCTGIGTSMTELAKLFYDSAGYSPELCTRADKPSGVAYRVGDPSRMLEFYQPRIALAEGVRRATMGSLGEGADDVF